MSIAFIEQAFILIGGRARAEHFPSFAKRVFFHFHEGLKSALRQQINRFLLVYNPQVRPGNGYD